MKSLLATVLVLFLVTGCAFFVKDEERTIVFGTWTEGADHGEIWAVTPQGWAAEMLIADGIAPDVSPDGQRIVYHVPYEEYGEIWVANIDGSSPTKLTDTGTDVYNSQPDFNHDGTKIAFASNRDGDFDIWVMDADGTNPVNLTDASGADDVRPEFSPDGTMIAYTSTEFSAPGAGHKTNVMGADGSNRRMVQLDSEFHHSWGPTWHPSGDTLLFTAWMGENTDPWNTVYEVDVDTGVQTLVISISSSAMEAYYSPDGSQIVFTHQPAGATYGQLYRIDTDGTGLRRIHSGSDFSCFQPNWIW